LHYLRGAIYLAPDLTKLKKNFKKAQRWYLSLPRFSTLSCSRAGA